MNACLSVIGIEHPVNLLLNAAAILETRTPTAPKTIAAALAKGPAVERALSRYRMKNARDLRLAYFQAAATAARHMFIADARKARCVLAEVRWR